MKTIIAGSRTITRIADVIDAIHKSGFEDQITEVVCGGAFGPDLNGKFVADSILHVPVVMFHPEWDKYGKSAGPIRNREMAQYADVLILVWDGKSAGSRSMLHEAALQGLKIYQHIVPSP